MDAEIRKRLKWVKAYDQIKSHGAAALKCGISRPTLRKWLRRYEEHGEVGLTSQSKVAEELTGTQNWGSRAGVDPRISRPSAWLAADRERTQPHPRFSGVSHDY